MQLFVKTFRCPDITSQEDAIVVHETLQNAPGIEEFQIDHVVHTVTIKTANQEGSKDVEAMLRAAGYPPEDE